MIPQRLDQKILDISPRLLALKSHVAATLNNYADKQNFPVSGRIKSPQSIAEKIEMGRYSCFADIDDLVAFTLIIPTANYEEEVIKFCKTTFDVVEIRNKASTRKAPDLFRFDSTRVIAKAKRVASVDSDVPSIFDHIFEIQVRTAFEHAWSVATHDLVYKSASVQWKRIRLAAQLKATSEGLDAAVAAFDQLANGIVESPWDRVDDRTQVSQYVYALLDSRRLPSDMKPESLSRFSDNLCTLIAAIRPQIAVRDALEVIDAELLKERKLPVSISLYQLCLGVLWRSGRVQAVKGIRCHVTNELTTIFPETKKIGPVFNYE